ARPLRTACPRAALCADPEAQPPPALLEGEILNQERDHMEYETKDATNDRELKSAFADFLAAFEQFKDANDERLAQIEKRHADVVSEEKVDRINKALDEQKRALDDLTLANARPHF